VEKKLLSVKLLDKVEGVVLLEGDFTLSGVVACA
jgi:hypothetical protein